MVSTFMPSKADLFSEGEQKQFDRAAPTDPPPPPPHTHTHTHSHFSPNPMKKYINSPKKWRGAVCHSVKETLKRTLIFLTYIYIFKLAFSYKTGAC